MLFGVDDLSTCSRPFALQRIQDDRILNMEFLYARFLFKTLDTRAKNCTLLKNGRKVSVT